MLCFSSDKCLRRDLSYHNDCGVRKWKEQGFYIPELEIYKFSFTFYLLNGVCYQHQLPSPMPLHPYTAVVPSHSCVQVWRSRAGTSVVFQCLFFSGWKQDSPGPTLPVESSWKPSISTSNQQQICPLWPRRSRVRGYYCIDAQPRSPGIEKTPPVRTSREHVSHVCRETKREQGMPGCERNLLQLGWTQSLLLLPGRDARPVWKTVPKGFLIWGIWGGKAH